MARTRSANRRNNNNSRRVEQTPRPPRSTLAATPAHPQRRQHPENQILALLFQIINWVIEFILGIFSFKIGKTKNRDENTSVIQPSETDINAVPSLLITGDDALEAIINRGVDNRLNSKEALKGYLLNLLSDPKFHAISIPLLRGLALGGRHINHRIRLHHHQEEPFPILFWVCQWKLLKAQGEWEAESELVDMVLKAGAKVNGTLQNKTNPLFFAVKYADQQTVNLLLKAGCNIRQLDYLGRTCLYNALERCEPSIITKLLTHLSATETFPNMYRDGRKYRATLADQVLQLLTQSNPGLSWRFLGEPSPEKLCETLLLLRRKGSCFSSEGSTVPLHAMGLLFRRDVDVNVSMMNSPNSFRKVAKTLIGEWIPEPYRPPGEEESRIIEDDVPVTCPICLSELSRKRISLYCGHTFCRRCIMNCAKEGSGSCCPVCRSQLCSDLGVKSPLDMREMLGLLNSPGYGSVGRLTNDQVVAEARFQGIFTRLASTESLRSQLQEGLEKGHRVAVSQQRSMSVDLSAGVSTFTPSNGFVRPKGGRVYIEVSVRNVPVLARICNRSFYTVVSKSVVEQLRIRTIPNLRSTKFVDVINAKKIRKLKFQCLEPFILRVGEIEVTLRNAITANEDPHPMFGIQLGCDFLYSALWCPIDVEIDATSESVGAPVVMRVDGEASWPTFKKSKEMLRFYSHDGKVAHLPLLHFSPFDGNVCLGISLKESVQFNRCFWCCRVFPDGMQQCPPCAENGRDVTYCDSRCQNAAWLIHKKICGVDHFEGGDEPFEKAD